ncbi:MAG: hypothetical protein DUD31_09740 [Coriobacteriaceae bacterium]|nr:MAG: hypothetical protein DUD31_09740 [Coriobacteriaceae bacterium]
MHHGEREDGGSTAIAEAHSIAAADDEEALRLARAWREGRGDAWTWLVGRCAQALEAGRRYESFRRLTDELSQVHDFTDDDGGKVSVPHRRGLGRGLALLMAEEHPEFGELFRMEGRQR